MRCLINDIWRWGVPLYLGSRDFAQVPWRQNLPSFISLINLFLSKFVFLFGERGCVKGDGLAVVAAMLLAEGGIESEVSTAEANGWIVFA